MKQFNSNQTMHAKQLFAEAMALHESQNLAQAKVRYEQVLKLLPNQPDAMHMLGVIAFQENDFEKAVTWMGKALVKLPRHPTLLFNLGNAYRAAGDLEAAEQMYLAALKNAPEQDSLEIQKNLGNVYKEKNQLTQAIACYDQILSNHPDHSYTLMNKGVALLTGGHFLEGWPLYESRLDVSPVRQQISPHSALPPRWDGTPLNGALLVLAEQGLGDQIFYGGLLNDLEKSNVNATVCLDDRLLPLFQRSFHRLSFIGISTLQSEKNIAASFAGFIHIGSLGQMYRRSVADFANIKSPYLLADSNQLANMQSRLKSGNRLVCGLSWDSKNAETGRTKRMQLTELLPALQTPNVRFVDLQYGNTQAERQSLLDKHGIDIAHFDDVDNFQDIDKLAAMIQTCDMVITVSNSTAHLAGAIGKPTLVMLPQHSPLWYWHLDSMISPWYPSVTLLRQTNAGDWGPVITRVSSILKGLANPS